MTDKKHLNVREAAAYCGVSVSFLNKRRMRGWEHLGPRFIRLSKRRVVYLVADLDAWIASGASRSDAA
jgi:predicted DNA-binding transcriptional regulator AlpA